MSASRHWKLLEIRRFLYCLAIMHLLTSVIAYATEDFEEYFLCRKCGREIARMTDLTNTPSKQALRQRNDTFGLQKDVLIQLFKNPHGAHFEVISASKADIFRTTEEWETLEKWLFVEVRQMTPELLVTTGIYHRFQEIETDTWFMGFNWKVIGCPSCHRHIGWEYLPKNKKDKAQKSFIGLVLENLLYQNDADSLLLIPKSYTS